MFEFVFGGLRDEEDNSLMCMYVEMIELVVRGRCCVVIGRSLVDFHF